MIKSNPKNESLLNASPCSTPSIQNQAIEATHQVRRRIKSLSTTDSVRSWLLAEHQEVAVTSHDRSNTLLENYARISALNALDYLALTRKLEKNSPRLPREQLAAKACFATIQARLPATVYDDALRHRFAVEPRLIHETGRHNDRFDAVSPTAKVVSYLRSLDPRLQLTSYRELSLQGEQILTRLKIVHPAAKALLAALFQSRYYAVNEEIRQTGSTQTIELAAGLSPRGMKYSQQNTDSIFVETDLPNLMSQKARLIQDSLVRSENPLEGLLHCRGVDALDRDSVKKAFRLFDPSRAISVVTEGLLLYFNRAELNQFLGNISSLLKEFPNAVWVTDMVTSADFRTFGNHHPSVASAAGKVFAMTNRQVVEKNLLADERAIEELLASYGLKVVSTVSLKSVAKSRHCHTTVSEKQRQAIVGNRKVYRIQAVA